MSRQVIHDGSGAIQIRFPYDARLVTAVRALPARTWNGDEKYWSVPDEHVVALVDLLEPEGFGFCEVTWRLYRERGSSLAPGAGRAALGRPADRREPGAPAGAVSDFTILRLNVRVQMAIRAAFPALVWIVGEVSGFNKAADRKIVDFQLVERDGRGRAIATIRATLFEKQRREIEQRLRAAGDPFQVEDEIKIRVRARVELHVEWGQYRLVIEDLDPSYTLGEAARRREEIRRKLAEEGILGKNLALTFPALPLRVGLVTSLGSDAYNDVLRTLQESGFAFRVLAHGARVQGRQTEPSVLNALDWLRARARDLDVVLICRGGGSRTDLAWFDSEPLARAVATFPIPVVVGIGHERDISALDFVGWTEKTPTAAAARLVNRVRAARDAIEGCLATILDQAGRLLGEEDHQMRERARRLAQAARAVLGRESAELAHRRQRTARATKALLRSSTSDLSRHSARLRRLATLLLERSALRLQDAARQLHLGARRPLTAARRRVDEVALLIGPRSSRLLALEGERAEGRERRLRLLDPRRVVERGYAILRGAAGQVVTDPAGAPRGTRLTAELRGGLLGLVSDGADGSTEK